MNSTRTLKSIIVALLLSLGFTLFYISTLKVPNEEALCVDYSSNDMNTLSAGLVHELVNGYRNRQLKAITSATSSYSMASDAEAIWFDLETVKEFIYQLEKKTQNFDASIGSESLGLRFYYASYPATINSADPDLGDLAGKGYEKHHTLVIIPTKRIGMEEVDFNPLDIETYTLGLKATGNYNYTEEGNTYNNRNPTELLGLGAKSKLPKPSDSSTRPGAQNHGGLYPPLGQAGLGF
jgi:hypothetical protein